MQNPSGRRRKTASGVRRGTAAAQAAAKGFAEQRLSPFFLWTLMIVFRCFCVAMPARLFSADEREGARLIPGKDGLMTTFRKGDLLEAPGIRIVTASSTLSQDDTLVMGLGAAYAMKCKFPRAPKLFGAMIKEYCGDCGVYGLQLFGSLGVLQTKCHYNDKVDAALITYGLSILQAVAQGQQAITFNLTHPGMAYGKTTLPVVERFINDMPANVVVWEKA
jgi:hypothetical protein